MSKNNYLFERALRFARSGREAKVVVITDCNEASNNFFIFLKNNLLPREILYSTRKLLKCANGCQLEARSLEDLNKIKGMEVSHILIDDFVSLTDEMLCVLKARARLPPGEVYYKNTITKNFR